MAEVDLSSADGYTHWARMALRYCDQDPMGHVNNTVYAQWFEAPRVLLCEEFVTGYASLNTVLARMTIDYLRETTFPGDVDVGGRLLALGRRSLRSGFAVFRDGECLATCECVNVFFDMSTRKSVDPPAAVRGKIEAHLRT